MRSSGLIDQSKLQAPRTGHKADQQTDRFLPDLLRRILPSEYDQYQTFPVHDPSSGAIVRA